jgi:hypothetical protein
MRDWNRYVRDHLPLPAMKWHRGKKIVEELACQLEDAYNEALSAGASDAEADARAREQIADWERLTADLLRAESEHTESRLGGWLDQTDRAIRRRGQKWAWLLRPTYSEKRSGNRHHRRPNSGPRDRRQHSYLQRAQSGPARSAPLPGAGTTRGRLCSES